jgi:hypothetical protein
MPKFSLNKKAKKYLEEVWGYDRLSDVDPLTASAIIENCEDGDAVDKKTGRVIWPLDFSIKHAILALHDIPLETTYKQFKKYYTIKWFNKGNAKKKYNEAIWKVSKEDQKLMDELERKGLLR